MQRLEDRLRDVIVGSGMALFGVVDAAAAAEYAEPDGKELISRLPRAISLGFRLSDAVIEPIEDGPTLLYKHHYKTANWLLDQAAARVAAAIQSEGFGAAAVPASQTVDWERQVGMLSHRVIAQAAGLGWVGRSTLVVHPVHGARVRYVTVLTDAPVDRALLSSRPQGRDDAAYQARLERGCAECERCIEVCPAGAISRERYDKERCLATLREFARRRGIGVHICGVCVKACPVKGTTQRGVAEGGEGSG